VNGKKIRFERIEWKSGGPYNSSPDPSRIISTLVWLKTRKRELENVMGGFPETGARQEICRPDVNLVQALLYAQSMDESDGNSPFCHKSKDQPLLIRGSVNFE